MRLALAWKAGGAGGVGTLDSPLWRPPREVMAEGVRAVRAATGVNVSPRGNRVTERHAGVQLRYGHDGLWYLFMRKSGTWELHVPPTSDPASLRPVMLELADAASWQRYPEADDDD